MQAPAHIVLIGPMGAGKSTTGRALAQALERAFVDLDSRIEHRAGRRIAEIFEHAGEAAFRALERTELCELLARAEPCVLATGGGAVLDAGSRRLMRERGFVVHLQVDVGTQLERLADDRDRPLLARPDREAALHAMAAAREPLYFETAHLRIDTTQAEPAAIAADLAARLRVACPAIGGSHP